MAEENQKNTKSVMDKLNEFQLDDLNNIDWENMGSWPILGKVVFCVLIFIVVSVGGYFYLVADQIEELENAQKKEQTLKSDYEKKSFQAANLEAYKEQMEEMETTFGTLLEQLPKEAEVPGLIDDISASALGSGLDLNLMDPQSMRNAEFYKELPINIEVTGGYHEMGAFVSALASLPRIVTLHDFTISGGGGKAGQGKSGTLRMKIAAKTYQYAEPQAKTAKKPAAKKGGRK